MEQDRQRAALRRLHRLGNGPVPDPFEGLEGAPDERDRPPKPKRQRSNGATATNTYISDEPALPAGFRLLPSGLHWLDPDPERASIHVAGPLRVEAVTTDGRGRAWGKLLTWNDPSGREHRWAMPLQMLAGDQTDLRATLLDRALFVSPSRKGREKLAEYLLLARPERRVLVTERLGWHGQAFVLGHATIAPQGAETIVLQTDRPDALPPLADAGTLEEWQREIAAPAAGNTRVSFAISCAFAAPLLGLLGIEGGGFHFRGASSTGKTTALHVAGSVWGGGGARGWVRSWRTTDNALEAVAAAHCDLLLCIDEMGEASPETVAASAYALANGSGKGRAARDGGARRVIEWRVLFLSSGEEALAHRLAEARGGPRRARAGQEIRVLDIPADAGKGFGLFEDTHGMSAAAFAERLGAAAKVHYGTAGGAWLRWLVGHRDQALAEARAHIETFRGRYLPAGASGQVERALRRFGLVAAAGELAAGACFVPWRPGEAARAAGACFGAWLSAREGGAGAHEDAAAIAAVRRFIEAHGEARFTPLLRAADGDDVEPERATINRAGWRRRGADGTWTYWVLPEVWRSEVCAGLDPQHVARVLVRAGHLQVGEGKNLAARQWVPGVGPVRVFVLRPCILDADRSE